MKLKVVRDRSRLMIDGRSNLHGVKAYSPQLDGWLELELTADGKLDAGKPVTGHLEVPVESMKSGIDIYDIELRRRLDTRRYPSITVEVLEVQEVEPLRLYRMAGNLSFHGMTRRTAGTMTVNKLDERTIEASGEQQFDLRDFEITPPKVLMFAVYPEIKVRLELVAERAE